MLVSLLFLSRSTAILGVILNSFLAYLGIIMMADFSLSATLAGQVKVMPGVDFLGWLLQTTLADIAILLADLLVGLSLYRVIMTERQSFWGVNGQGLSGLPASPQLPSSPHKKGRPSGSPLFI